MTNWIIPADIKIYDLEESFAKNGYVDWRQKVSYAVGDIVYIYLSQPISGVRYKTKVEKIGLSFEETIDDTEFQIRESAPEEGQLYARLALIRRVELDYLSLNYLLENGLNAAPQSPTTLTGERAKLINYLEKYFNQSEINYQWIPFYRELADKLYGYINRKDELFEIIKDLRKEYKYFNYLNFENEEWWGPRNYIIDPFSVMAVMNRGITDENRIKIAAIYTNKFGIQSPIPQSFDGIPVLNNMNSFYGDTEDNHLWVLFKEALEYAESKEVTEELIQAFDKVREKSGTGLAMITIGLYWIRPNVFMPLDSLSRGYLSKVFGMSVPSANAGGKAYFSFLEEMEAVAGGQPFYELSFDAWESVQQTEELTTESWIELLNDPSVFTEKSKITFKALLDHEGKATCTQLANKYGRTKNFYKNNAQHFGRRVAEKTGMNVLVENGKERWWRVPFTGEDAPEDVAGSYYWILRPELRAALRQIDLSDYPLYDDIKEVKEPKPDLDVDFNQEIDFGSLYFEDEELLKTQIQLALKSGKDIILIGPPGTGKSKIAKAISESYKVDHKMVTAMSDWSSYDTIGGYKPNDSGTLYFEEGIFLSALKDKEKRRKNQWLIIDEINRADIDKAFGPFLSALSGDNVELGLKDLNDQNIELVLEENFAEDTEFQNHQYIISKDWRIIGTMNTFDKTSLYEMSYAFMRRFAFIPVSIPRNIDAETVRELCQIWRLDSFYDYTNMAKLWIIINNYRKIGPAIVEDLSQFIALGGDYISSIVLYVLPQLEGLYDTEIEKFFVELKELVFIYGTEFEKEMNIQRLRIAIEDFFDINLSED